MSLTANETERRNLRGIGRGLDAFETSSEFRGPVESLDGHHCNDHFAQIYETDQQRFAAAIPFVRHGLDHGERVMYVVEEGNETEIEQVLASADIDVDGAMADGSFSIHTVQETYLREGSFEPDEMVEFYADVADAASEEYDALRIVAETTWLQDDDTSIEQFMEYEAKVNELFDNEDCVAICQYERDGFAPEIIMDILQTHPHLIYGDTVCHNFYYTPPAEFFGPEQPANEVDRMLGTLLDRTAAKAALERRQTYLRRQTEIIADPASAFEEKLQALFDLGCERFDLDVGGIAKVDPEADRFVIEHASVDDDRFRPGRELPLSETYCKLPVESNGTEAVLDPTEAGLDDLMAYRELGVTVYLGTFIEVEGDVDRTFFFASTESRDGSFTEDERTFLGLMGQWASDEFQRRQRERLLERCYQITSAPGRPFEDKLEELLELGREWLDFDVGYFAATDCEADEFEIIESVGSNDLAQVGDSGPLSTSYCRRVLESEQPFMFRDVRRMGWESDPAYELYGMDSFLGTRLVVDGELYGTLCFGGRNPRDGRITDFETTFVDLLSQWVTYEIERQRREDRLEGLNSLSRTLMDAETAPAMAENVVTAVAEDLELPIAATALYDDQSGDLETAARTDAAAPLLDRSSLLDTRTGACWDAFVSGEVVREDDPAVPSRDESAAVAELVAIPLCKHGVLLVGTTAPDGFTSADVDILETAGGTASAALDRVDRERQVQERERTLEEQNETLERLNRINDTIRRIDQALVESTTREAAEQVVCEELAAAGPYEFAWIGNHDSLTDEITPTELAGADKGYLEEVVVTADDERTGQGPAGKAVTTREPQVVNNVLQDPTFESRCQAALNRGYHSLTALPLEYENSLYGVLVVYAGQPNVFDQLERTVLTEMADTIAHAINAVESKKALVSDEVTELEFGLEDSTFELVDVARSSGCEFHFESLVPQTDGPLRSFGTVSGVSAATFEEFSTQLPVTALSTIVERETNGDPVALFEFTLDESSLSHAVWQHGGRMQQLDVTSDGASLVVHLAADAEIREFVEMLKSRYPGTELTAQRRRSQPVRTETGFLARLTEDFTDRQREALQTAYFSGYFEQPRTRTASEIAATMDISQPTFNAHLRNALEKLCDQLFDAHPQRR